jgi:hypothetical protein
MGYLSGGIHGTIFNFDKVFIIAYTVINYCGDLGTLFMDFILVLGTIKSQMQHRHWYTNL